MDSIVCWMLVIDQQRRLALHFTPPPHLYVWINRQKITINTCKRTSFEFQIICKLNITEWISLLSTLTRSRKKQQSAASIHTPQNCRMNIAHSVLNPTSLYFKLTFPLALRQGSSVSITWTTGNCVRRKIQFLNATQYWSEINSSRY